MKHIAVIPRHIAQTLLCAMSLLGSAAHATTIDFSGMMSGAGTDGDNLVSGVGATYNSEPDGLVDFIALNNGASAEFNVAQFDGNGATKGLGLCTYNNNTFQECPINVFQGLTIKLSAAGISANGGSPNFTFTSLWMKNIASQTTTATMVGKKSGVQVGSTVNIDFTSPTTIVPAGDWGTIDELVITANTDFVAVIDDFTYTAVAGGGNATPVISIDNAALAYTENNAATQIDAAGTVSDSDGDADWNGGTLAVQITANNEVADEISIADTDGDGTAITVSGLNIFANATDIGDLSTSGGVVTNGTTLTITFDADATNANVQEVLQSIRYRNTSDNPGTANRTLTFTATDKNAAGASDTRTITVTAQNDAPVLGSLNGDSLAYAEGDGATTLDNSGNATVQDVDSADFNGGSLTVTITAGKDAAEDVLGLDTSGTVALAGTTAGSNVSVGGTVVGTLGNNIAAGNNLVVNLNANATPANVQTLVRAISYQNTDNATPTGGARTVRTTVNDGDGGTSANADVTVTVSAVNDDPAIAGLPTDVTVTEDTLSNLDLSAATLSDIDAGASSITLTIGAGAGTLTATSGGGVTVGGSGTGSLTLSGSVGNIDTYLNTATNLKYTGAANAQGNNADTLSVSANDGGNTGIGGGANVALGTVNVDITDTGDVPNVTNATTNENTQSSTGLVISRNVNDSTAVTHFKITGISGGTLYKNDGSTQIVNNDFITFAEGNAGLKFTPDLNSVADGTFFVQAGTDAVGGGLSVGSAQATITISAVNSPPTLTSLHGDAVSYAIGASGVQLDAAGDATLTDVDSSDFNGGNVTVSVVANAFTGEDVLRIGTVGNIATSGSNVTHTDGVTIGTFAGGTGGASLVISLNANATPARARDLVSALQYFNSNAVTTNTATRTVSITVDDGDGGDSTSSSQDVAVTLVRAPIIDLDGDDSSGAGNGGYNGSFTEGGGAVATADSDTLITDDGTFKALTVTLTTRPDGVEESLASSYGIGGQTVNAEAVTIGAYNSVTGVLTIVIDDGSASAATMTLLMESIRYNNTSLTPTTTARSITYFATDDANNAGAVSTAVLTVTAANSPRVGDVVITGGSVPPLVGETLTADTTAITDGDGLGAFSYQWKRNGTVISGATALNYTLVATDSGSTITVTASYTDGQGTNESSTSDPIGPVDGDFDGDGQSDSVDVDDDNDGMLDTWEILHGLDPFNAADAETDLDGDGLANRYEHDNELDPTTDDNPPMLTVPATVTVNGVGLFTAVELGTATATDAKDGTLTPRVTHLDGNVVTSTPTHFSPGAHMLTWTATDAAGNDATATQAVNVTPLVSLSKNQVTTEGATSTFQVILNGPPVTYPVEVPYTVGGTAATDGSDHDLGNGSVVIEAPNLQATVTVTTVADSLVEGAETLVVTLGDTPTNAVLGVKQTHTLTIYEENVAPEVALQAVQGNGSTRIIAQDGGTVVVTATVKDPNTGDIHTYDWSKTDNALVDLDDAEDTFTFDASSLSPGFYKLRIEVSDGDKLAKDRLKLRVEQALPQLDEDEDSDGDGVNDSDEGLGDNDDDGIPDFLDHASLARNVLQERRADSSSFLMETEPGLVLSLGEVAFRANGARADVTMDDVVTHGNEGTGAIRDEEFRYEGGLFDFNVEDLPPDGQSVNIVIPQFAAIPANAVYRKLMPSGWASFVENDNNRIASAPGSQGFCPPPGNENYVAGLTEGHWCVQLTIEDGGPNDADGEVNQVVDDPGGVAVAIAGDDTTPPPATDDTPRRGGGGALGPQALLILLGLYWLMGRRKV